MKKELATEWNLTSLGLLGKEFLSLCNSVIEDLYKYGTTEWLNTRSQWMDSMNGVIISESEHKNLIAQILTLFLKEKLHSAAQSRKSHGYWNFIKTFVGVTTNTVLFAKSGFHSISNWTDQKNVLQCETLLKKRFNTYKDTLRTPH